MNSLKPVHIGIAFVLGVIGGAAFALGSRIEGLAAGKLNNSTIGAGTPGSVTANANLQRGPNARD